MAIALVQSKVAVAASTATLSFDSPVTAGNLLIVTRWGWESATPHTAPTDNIGTGTWAEATSVEHAGNEGQGNIWYMENAPGGSYTIDGSHGGTNYWFQISEWSGVPTSGVLDVVPTPVSDDDTSPFDLATGTLSQADELIVGVCTWSGENGATITQSGLTNNIQEIADQAGQAGTADYLIVSSTSTVTYSVAVSGGAGGLSNGVVCVATFKASGAPPTNPDILFLRR